MDALIGIEKRIGVTIGMTYHEILITFMRATRVPPSGVDFFNTPKEFTLGGNGETLDAVFGRRKMHPAEIRTLNTGCFFHRKVNTSRYE